MSILIAIAGASASGKSQFAEHMVRELKRSRNIFTANILPEDSYYQPQCHLSLEERAILNFDHPKAIDCGLMLEHLQELKLGNQIDKPVYCYKTHTRIGSESHLAADVVILEGLHVLSRELVADLVDLNIFIDTPMDICLLRRTIRDVKERARTVESVFQQYTDFVRPMFLEHVEPGKDNADIVIDGQQTNEAMWQELTKNNKYKSLIS